MRTLLERWSSLAFVAALCASTSLARAQDEVPASEPSVPPPASPTSESVAAPQVTQPVAMPQPMTCVGRVSRHARAAAVRVESGLEVGAGFLVIDGAHVITAYALVADGHGVRVVDVGGNARSARVIATAPDDDAALLELVAPLAGTPLAIAPPDSVQVGDEVVVVAFASVEQRRGGMRPRVPSELDFSLAGGAIDALGTRALQTDAAPASVGSPLIRCDGQVVGIASERWSTPGLTAGAGAGALVDLASRADRPEGHGGRFRLTLGIGLSLAYEDRGVGVPDLLAGGYLQVGFTAFDAFALSVRGHYLRGGADPSGGSVLHREAERFRGDAFAAWRQLVLFGPGMGFYFELGLGASVSMLRDSQRTLVGTTAAPAVLNTSTDVWRVRPLAVVNLEFGPLVIGYAAELDLTDRGNGHVYHLWTLGLQN